MARHLRILSAGIERPDERFIRAEDKVGPSVAVHVASEDLKARPVHVLRIDEDEALRLAEQLLHAVLILRKER
jgi:hypothetical protein